MNTYFLILHSKIILCSGDMLTKEYILSSLLINDTIVQEQPVYCGYAASALQCNHCKDLHYVEILSDSVFIISEI